MPPIFTEREQQQLAIAWNCVDEIPKVNLARDDDTAIAS